MRAAPEVWPIGCYVVQSQRFAIDELTFTIIHHVSSIAYLAHSLNWILFNCNYPQLDDERDIQFISTSN